MADDKKLTIEVVGEQVTIGHADYHVRAVIEIHDDKERQEFIIELLKDQGVIMPRY